MRQVPGLGVAVALLRAVAAVQVGDDRHRPSVGVLVAAVPVAALRATGRVGPVKRLVDRQQVRPEVAVRLDEVVDPLDAHRPPPRGLDRERRVVERLGVVDRPVAPDRRRVQPHACRQDVLGELAHRDLVVVDADARLAGKALAARHRRRDHQRRDVLRDRERVEHARRNRNRLRHCPTVSEAPQQQARTRAHPVLHEPAPGDPRSGDGTGAVRVVRVMCTVATPFDSSRSSAAESTVKRGAGNPNAH